jgi:hypothetical protein
MGTKASLSQGINPQPHTLSRETRILSHLHGLHYKFHQIVFLQTKTIDISFPTQLRKTYIHVPALHFTLLLYNHGVIYVILLGVR